MFFLNSAYVRTGSVKKWSLGWSRNWSEKNPKTSPNNNTSFEQNTTTKWTQYLPKGPPRARSINQSRFFFPVAGILKTCEKWGAAKLAETDRQDCPSWSQDGPKDGPTSKMRWCRDCQKVPRCLIEDAPRKVWVDSLTSCILGLAECAERLIE